jgi:putative oxidoreductase
MSRRLVYWASRILACGFGFLLVYASLDKLLYPADFAKSVENYRIVGAGLSALVAVWLPAFEAILGLMVIAGIWPKEAAFLNASLMFVFLALVVQAFVRGLDIECGCFGSHSSSIGIWKLLENVVFALAAGVLLWLESKKVDSW